MRQGPPGCTRRPAPHLIPAKPDRHQGQDDILSLPSRSLAALGCRGSNQTPFTPPERVGAKQIRSSPVYAGYAIKPLKNLRSSRAPAVSDRIEAHQSTDGPCSHSTGTKLPLPFERPCGRPGRNSLLLSELYGMRARTRQQRPARPEAAVYPLLSALPRAKIGPLRIGSKGAKPSVRPPTHPNRTDMGCICQTYAATHSFELEPFC